MLLCYGAFLLIKPCYPGSSNPIHYLYAMAVLFPIELLIMWYLNKYHPAEEYEIHDVGAVDLTPWKYRHVVSIIGLLLALGIYILFLPSASQPDFKTTHTFSFPFRTVFGADPSLSGGEFDPHRRVVKYF